MKIFTSILGTAPGERETGASVVDLQFIHHVAAEGHRVTVVVPDGREAGLQAGVQVQVLHTPRLVRGPWNHLVRLLRTAYRLVELYRDDYQGVFRVNSFFSSLLEVAPLLLYSRGGARLFVQFHHKDHSRLRNAIARQVLRWAQVIVCPSEAARQDLLELLGYAAGNLKVVHHGVDNKFFVARSTLLKCQATSDQPLRLLFVGHLERRKNPSALLSLAQALYADHVPFELAIVGKGPELEGLQEQCIDQPWAADVLFLGAVSDEEKLNQYAYADLFVFPSKQEGFGLVLCEAMAAGVPVLAFNTSAMPEIVQPGTGYLVEVDDMVAMAEIVRRLAGDRLQLDLLRGGAIQHARTQFCWQQKVGEICGLLESAFQPAQSTLDGMDSLGRRGS